MTLGQRSQAARKRPAAAQPASLSIGNALVGARADAHVSQRAKRPRAVEPALPVRKRPSAAPMLKRPAALTIVDVV